MFSKRSLEGCLSIDHRDSPGLTPDVAHASGLGGQPIGRGMMFESATITCSHCQAGVVLNPNRSRSRGYCPSCDAYICDSCEAVRVVAGECRSFEKFADTYLNAAAKGLPLPVFNPYKPRA